MKNGKNKLKKKKKKTQKNILIIKKNYCNQNPNH